MRILAPKPIRPIQHAQMELEVTAYATWLSPAADNHDSCTQELSPAMDDAGSKSLGVPLRDDGVTFELEA